MFKFDEHQACLQQNQRKDSASSEVAALLCISGRTSRISSVGSQGSALSRLSAISGVSRSPSPHKMLLETSFCGPKPLDNAMIDDISVNIDIASSQALEQALIAQSEAAIKPKEISTKNASLANGTSKNVERSGTTPELVVSRPLISRAPKLQQRSEPAKAIIGITTGGVEYTRINLKPDHMYPDQGVAPNEKIFGDSKALVTLVKPATLSLSEGATKKSSKHFTQLVQTNDDADAITRHPIQPLSQPQPHRLSPKPSRHIALRDMGSRSPSPITVNVSRKNSLCSLFKSKESAAPSPDSPPIAAGQVRKKSSASILHVDSPRDRSRSKSRESERGGSSQNNTPSKQKSVLAIFKPKRSGSVSKSASPVDPEAMSALENVQFQFTKRETPPPDQSRPRSRLRYYDAPLDGKSIHIPLHTPPDEKENELCTVNVIKERRQQNETQSANTASTNSVTLVRLPDRPKLTELPAPGGENRSRSTTPNPSKKSRIIENPDGSIRIPLKSDSYDVPDEDSLPASTSAKVTANRSNAHECQEIGISTQAPSQTNAQLTTCSTSRKQPVNAFPLQNGSAVVIPRSSSPIVSIQQAQQPTEIVAQSPNITTITPPNTSTTTPVTSISNTTTMPVVVASSATKEKKRILFCTKIGSGSEEQLFATQLSLSKTESLCSQLSEQASILDSPNGTVTPVAQAPHEAGSVTPLTSSRTESITAASIARKFDDAPISVTMRRADVFEDTCKRIKPKPTRDFADGVENANTIRHSRYIENIDEIMERQGQLAKANEPSRHSAHSSDSGSFDKTAAMSTIKKRKPEPVLQIPGPPADVKQSAEDLSEAGPSGVVQANGNGGGSSGSERDSELCTMNSMKQHLPRQIGNVEEESTGLVAQESFEDELPYVPTTLPEERSVQVSLVPVKERSMMEVRTCPVERPRSTTPLNPSCLEAYCGTAISSPFSATAPTTIDDADITFGRGEKLRISLPRRESRERGQVSKSPRRTSNSSGKSWFEFAEQGLSSTPTGSGLAPATAGVFNTAEDESPPPPLPPRKPQNVTQWINFENIPEKRKPPKRITTLPNKESSIQSGLDKNIAFNPSQQFSYVNPDECQCECHESERDSVASGSGGSVCQPLAITGDCHPPDETMPLLDEHGNTVNQPISRYIIPN